MIRFQLTEQEIVRGSLKYRKPRVRPWLVIVMAALGTTLLVCNYHHPRVESAAGFYFGCWLVGMATLVLLLQPLALRRAFTRLVRSHPIYTAPKEVYFDVDRLISTSATQRSEVAWGDYKKITEDEQYIYFHSDELGNVSKLPKRAFGPESLGEFLKCSQSVPRS